MATSIFDKVLRLVGKAGVLRPRELDAHNIPRQYLRILAQQGRIQRLGRGLYALADAELTEEHMLAEACKRVPHGVICLLSALQMHRLTTQLPFEVWMAIDRKRWKPTIDHPPIRFARFSGDALTCGVMERKIEGVAVRYYDAAKTVADCFKYRNKVGIDVAIEALRDCWRQKKAGMDELFDAARICRVVSVMRPYMESLT